MGFWKIKCPSVIQNSTAKGSHKTRVAVGEGGINVGVASGTMVANGVNVIPGKASAAAGCTTGAQEVRKMINIKGKIRCFIGDILLAE